MLTFFRFVKMTKSISGSLITRQWITLAAVSSVYTPGAHGTFTNRTTRAHD